MTTHSGAFGRIPRVPPKPELPDLAAARKLGPAETVETRWQQLLLVWRWHHERYEALHPGDGYPGIVALIEAAGAEPRLRQHADCRSG